MINQKYTISQFGTLLPFPPVYVGYFDGFQYGIMNVSFIYRFMAIIVEFQMDSHMASLWTRREHHIKVFSFT
jgi:hypothetical protein